MGDFCRRNLRSRWCPLRLRHLPDGHRHRALPDEHMRAACSPRWGSSKSVAGVVGALLPECSSSCAPGLRSSSRSFGLPRASDLFDMARRAFVDMADGGKFYATRPLAPSPRRLDQTGLSTPRVVSPRRRGRLDGCFVAWYASWGWFCVEPGCRCQPSASALAGRASPARVWQTWRCRRALRGQGRAASYHAWRHARKTKPGHRQRPHAAVAAPALDPAAARTPSAARTPHLSARRTRQKKAEKKGQPCRPSASALAQSEGRRSPTRQPSSTTAPDAPPGPASSLRADITGRLVASSASARRTSPAARRARQPEARATTAARAPSSNWSRYVDAGRASPTGHATLILRDDWDEPATQPPPPPPPERAAGSSPYDDASENPYYHDRPPVEFDGTSPRRSTSRAGSALFVSQAGAVPPPPSEEAEEAPPPQRTLRRPSNPFAEETGRAGGGQIPRKSSGGGRCADLAARAWRAGEDGRGARAAARACS